MPAPLVVQTSAEASGAGSATVSLSSVTAGATIAVYVWQTTTGARSYTATGCSTAVATTGTGRQAAILLRTAAAAGSHSITVVANTGTLTVSAIAVELGVCSFGSADLVNEATNNLTHDCATSGNLDAAANAIILSLGVLNASGTSLTPASGATQINASSTVMAQYRRSDTGFTDEQSRWSSSTARTAVNVSVALIGPSSGSLRRNQLNQDAFAGGFAA